VRIGLLEVTRLMSALVVGVTVAACNHSDDSGTQPTTQTYTLAVANGTVTAAPGGTATQTVNITRTGGFTGAVALTASGLPTGVTAAFDPQSATGNSSTLTLTAAANVRTLALVEVLFAQAVAHYSFKQPLSGREFGGIALIVIGVALLVAA